MNKEMDELDRRLIVELQNDPRQSNTHLAMSLGITESTVRKRIEHLVSSGTLLLTVLPNLGVLGYPIQVFILLQVEHSGLEAIGEQLCRMPCLRFVCSCIGGADFFTKGAFASAEVLADFILYELGKIKGVSRIETLLIYKELKLNYTRLRFSSPPKMTITPLGDIAISETDRRLILQLQKNARSPLKELAQDIGVSKSTIHRRIKELVRSRTIELTAIPNVSEVGYPTRCNISIQTVPANLPYVAESMTEYPEVKYVGLISGPAQLLIGMDALSAEELSEFVTRELSQSKDIIKVESVTYLKVLKHHFTWLQ